MPETTHDQVTMPDAIPDTPLTREERQEAMKEIPEWTEGDPNPTDIPMMAGRKES